MRNKRTRLDKKIRKYRVNRTRKIRGGNPNNPRIFHLFNRFHYGDNILNLKFFYNIAELLEQKKIHIHYYYNHDYIKRQEELDRYIHHNKTVSLHTLSKKPANAIELWMGNPINGIDSTKIDKYFNLYYKIIVKALDLEDSKINTSLYQDEPYLQDIYNKLDPKFKDLEILIINAEPKSGQLVYDKKKFNEMCIRLSKKYRVATTMKVAPEIPCTMDAGLMMQDIGAISTHAKYIIGVHSGPVTACFNSTTHANVKKWILFADNNTTHESHKIVVVKSKYDMNTIEKNIN